MLEIIMEILKEISPYSTIFLATIGVAFLSGNLWICVLFEYSRFSGKGGKIINSGLGKITLGLGWIIIFFLPEYFFIHHSLNISPLQITDMVLSTLVHSFFVQIVIFALITTFVRDNATRKRNVPRT
jgi:hypothetical protein